jgi:hypothetical protein
MWCLLHQKWYFLCRSILMLRVMDIASWCDRECLLFASISGRETTASSYHRRYASAGREKDCFTRTPDPSWGIPAADFPMSPDLCNYDEHFDAHQIIFSLTFCVSPERLFYLPSTFARAQLKFLFPFPQRDWAGNDWPSSGCGPDTCGENCKHLLAYNDQLLRS